MRTLSDHIFDLAQNSINAGAQNITITVEENEPANLFRIVIQDDGKGIKPDNIAAAALAGADTFVAGSAIFGTDNYAETIATMRGALAGLD